MMMVNSGFPVETDHQLQNFFGRNLVKITCCSSATRIGRICNHRPGNGHTLLLAAGKLTGIMVHAVGQIDQTRKPFSTCSKSSFRVIASEWSGSSNVFKGCQNGNQIVELKNKTHMRRTPVAEFRLGKFCDFNATPGWSRCPPYQFRQSGFSRVLSGNPTGP